MGKITLVNFCLQEDPMLLSQHQVIGRIEINPLEGGGRVYSKPTCQKKMFQQDWKGESWFRCLEHNTTHALVISLWKSQAVSGNQCQLVAWQGIDVLLLDTTGRFSFPFSEGSRNAMKSFPFSWSIVFDLITCSVKFHDRDELQNSVWMFC